MLRELPGFEMLLPLTKFNSLPKQLIVRVAIMAGGTQMQVVTQDLVQVPPEACERT